MLKLLRRISSSIYPRSDRPWSDDATSNAPTIGRKRRMSDDDDDVQDAGSSRKRRGQLERQDTSDLSELGIKASEADPGVKEVTRGVKEVELEDKKEGTFADDDGKGTTKDAPETETETADGESNVALPFNPGRVPQKDDGASQDTTVTSDNLETLVDQSEAVAADAPPTDSPDIVASGSTDVKQPPAQVGKENEQLDSTPGASSDQVASATETVPRSPKSSVVTTHSPEAGGNTVPAH